MVFQNVGIFCSPSLTGARNTLLMTMVVLIIKILNWNSITEVIIILNVNCLGIEFFM